MRRAIEVKAEERGMGVSIERDALVALLDCMLRAEAREDAPPKAERSE